MARRKNKTQRRKRKKKQTTSIKPLSRKKGTRKSSKVSLSIYINKKVFDALHVLVAEDGSKTYFFPNGDGNEDLFVKTNGIWNEQALKNLMLHEKDEGGITLKGLMQIYDLDKIDVIQYVTWKNDELGIRESLWISNGNVKWKCDMIFALLLLFLENKWWQKATKLSYVLWNKKIRGIGKCSHCGRFASEIKKCKRCRNVKYCSRRCQKKSWKKEHRQICNSDVA